MTDNNSYSPKKAVEPSVDITEENANNDLFSAALLELDELISRIGPIKNKDVKYLLNFWGWFSIYQIEPAFLEKSTTSKNIVSEEEEEGGGSVQQLPHVTRIKDGWKVLDYGDGLITSAGENYGFYSTGPLLKTVKHMVACLAKRGAKVVVFSGNLPAKRMAWMECIHYGISNRFSPNQHDVKCQEGLVKILQGKFPSYKI